MPEWARNALQTPVVVPKHFAQAEPLGPPLPVIAAPYNAIMPQPVQPVAVPQPAVQPQQPAHPLPVQPAGAESVKRLTLASPRSSRRRREATPSLDLDVEQ